MGAMRHTCPLSPDKVGPWAGKHLGAKDCPRCKSEKERVLKTWGGIPGLLADAELATREMMDEARLPSAEELIKFAELLESKARRLRLRAMSRRAGATLEMEDSMVEGIGQYASPAFWDALQPLVKLPA